MATCGSVTLIALNYLTMIRMWTFMSVGSNTFNIPSILIVLGFIAVCLLHDLVATHKENGATDSWAAQLWNTSHCGCQCIVVLLKQTTAGAEFDRIWRVC